MTFMMYTRNALMWKILDVREFIQGKLELRTISITCILGISRTRFLKWNIFITIDINFRFGLPNPRKNDMTLLKHWKTMISLLKKNIFTIKTSNQCIQI